LKKIIINKIDTIFDAIYFFDKIIDVIDGNLIINFSSANFIRNHFLSIIGMGLEVVKKRGVSIDIIKPKDPKVLHSMKRINFLSVFCDEDNKDDTYKTMVKYTNIPLKDNSLILQEFYSYFIMQFVGKVGNLSPQLQKKILQKIFELFSNVFRHSDSPLGLFCSGQFYPTQDKFNFTIVDNGITIRKNVNKYLTKEFIKSRSSLDKLLGKKFEPINSVESIRWALMNNNSTTGEGGLGLSLLMDLIKASNGSIEIISGNGYYGINNADETVKELKKSFAGTIISIELNTNSGTYYFLKEEKND
jgi:3-deoxy-D-manno-octulosonate 8-phosphate phosphatase KdsC-like HAD superfamily phosphatase